jgi:hypothetical protein
MCYLEFFYIPPKSTQDIWEKLESSIEMAINDTAIDDVIITGDFNDNQLDHSLSYHYGELGEYSNQIRLYQKSV